MSSKTECEILNKVQKMNKTVNIGILSTQNGLLESSNRFKNADKTVIIQAPICLSPSEWNGSKEVHTKALCHQRSVGLDYVSRAKSRPYRPYRYLGELNKN